MSLAEIMPSNVYYPMPQEEVLPHIVRVRKFDVKRHTIIESGAANPLGVKGIVFTDAVRVNFVVAVMLLALSGLLSLSAVVFEAKTIGVLGAFTLAGAMIFFVAWTNLAEKEMSSEDKLD